MATTAAGCARLQTPPLNVSFSSISDYHLFLFLYKLLGNY